MTLAAPAASEPAALRPSLPVQAAAPVALALLAFATTAFLPAILADGDTWSHVATGQWILSHGAVPHADPFSFTRAGAPWTAHEWLSELALALAFRAAGWGGVMALTGACFGLAVLIVARRVARELAGPAAVVLGLIAYGLLAPSLLARPHILALPVFALWCEALFSAREQDRTPPLAFAALMALWANLHGGFAFGLALIAPFALEAVANAAAERRLAATKAWVLFALASLVAALATPFGVEGLVFPLRLLGLSRLAQVGEWRAEDFSHPNAMEFALVAMLAVALARPLRLPPLRLILLLGLVHMSLAHGRHEMLLAVLGPMLLARPLADALPAPASPAPGLPRAALAAALVAAIVISGARWVLPQKRQDSASAPMSALAAMPDDVKALPVLNSYSFGGYLIFEGYKPFVDGRADMFGDAFLTQFDQIMSADSAGLSEALTRWGIGWTIFAPGQRIVAVMDREPGWRRLYADGYAVVHVRDDLGLKRE